MRFRAQLMLHGKTATGFEVPASVVEALGAGKRPPVRVTINGYTYRNTVAVYGGQHLIGVSDQHRKGAGVAAGDLLDVELELDTEPREVAVPADLAAALDGSPAARRAFDALSYSQRSGHVQSVEGAKTEATRQRRIAKVVSELAPGLS
jgi:Bacteriocin-protection, YdeI or OmpD-Associated/Domain of unknown function (DUF1905)